MDVRKLWRAALAWLSPKNPKNPEEPEYGPAYPVVVLRHAEYDIDTNGSSQLTEEGAWQLANAAAEIMEHYAQHERPTFAVYVTESSYDHIEVSAKHLAGLLRVKEVAPSRLLIHELLDVLVVNPSVIPVIVTNEPSVQSLIKLAYSGESGNARARSDAAVRHGVVYLFKIARATRPEMTLKKYLLTPDYR